MDWEECLKKRLVKDISKDLEFVKSLGGEDVMLPKLIQHGDLTEDNILFEYGEMHIIDYDFVNVTDLPGFDLFGLLNRYNSREVKKCSCCSRLPRS